MRERVLGFLIWLGYRTLSWTWRIALHEPESMRSALHDGRPFILAHWHGDEFALLPLIRRYRIATLASRSRDGRIMAVLLELLGAKTCAGSSSRGGATSLKGLIRLVRSGAHNCSFAVDGPRGPIYKVKPGVLQMARMLGCPTYYPTINCDRAILFHTAWDRGYMPKPFARISIEFHGPFEPISHGQDPRDVEVTERLESLMREAKRRGRTAHRAPD